LKHNTQTALATTAILWAFIYAGARKGFVAPIFSQYGRVAKTHRVFRQYLWSLIGPLFLAQYLTRTKFIDTINLQWAVHANRMRRGLLSDPQGTIPPTDLSRKREHHTF